MRTTELLPGLLTEAEFFSWWIGLCKCELAFVAAASTNSPNSSKGFPPTPPLPPPSMRFDEEEETCTDGSLFVVVFCDEVFSNRFEALLLVCMTFLVPKGSKSEEFFRVTGVGGTSSCFEKSSGGSVAVPNGSKGFRLTAASLPQGSCQSSAAGFAVAVAEFKEKRSSRRLELGGDWWLVGGVCEGGDEEDMFKRSPTASDSTGGYKLKHKTSSFRGFEWLLAIDLIEWEE